MSFISDKIKNVIDYITLIEEKLGIVKFMQYVLFIFVMYVAFNFNSIVENVIKFQTEIERQNHAKKLEQRDEMTSELNPLLIELRSKTGASRILYFEYHNSTENFVGIPFKYANLVNLNQDHICEKFDISKYKDISSGLLSSIYNDLRKDEIIINRGPKDEYFQSKYSDIDSFFSSQDGSCKQIYINLPGTGDIPMGMIVLEWMPDSETPKNWENTTITVAKELLRINALISKYSEI